MQLFQQRQQDGQVGGRQEQPAEFERVAEAASDGLDMDDASDDEQRATSRAGNRCDDKQHDVLGEGDAAERVSTDAERVGQQRNRHHEFLEELNNRRNSQGALRKQLRQSVLGLHRMLKDTVQFTREMILSNGRNGSKAQVDHADAQSSFYSRVALLR